MPVRALKRSKLSERRPPSTAVRGSNAKETCMHSRNCMPCTPAEVDEDSDFERDEAEWEVRTPAPSLLSWFLLEEGVAAQGIDFDICATIVIVTVATCEVGSSTRVRPLALCCHAGSAVPAERAREADATIVLDSQRASALPFRRFAWHVPSTSIGVGHSLLLPHSLSIAVWRCAQGPRSPKALSHARSGGCGRSCRRRRTCSGTTRTSC